MIGPTLEERVADLLVEYAGTSVSRPFDPSLTLRGDLGVESLSLVSLAIRLGDALGVDLAEREVALGGLRTVGDLMALARSLDGSESPAR